MNYINFRSLPIRLGTLVLMACSVCGCAVVMATRQPSKKNLDVLRPGTDRDRVIAEIGVPVFSEKIDGGKKEI